MGSAQKVTHRSGLSLVEKINYSKSTDHRRLFTRPMVINLDHRSTIPWALLKDHDPELPWLF